jgi:hypothetical protein
MIPKQAGVTFEYQARDSFPRHGILKQGVKLAGREMVKKKPDDITRIGSFSGPAATSLFSISQSNFFS